MESLHAARVKHSLRMWTDISLQIAPVTDTGNHYSFVSRLSFLNNQLGSQYLQRNTHTEITSIVPSRPSGYWPAMCTGAAAFRRLVGQRCVHDIQVAAPLPLTGSRATHRAVRPRARTERGRTRRSTSTFTELVKSADSAGPESNLPDGLSILLPNRSLFNAEPLRNFCRRPDSRRRKCAP